MKKNAALARQSAIKELVTTQEVADQQSLVQMLKERYNISTNQSMLSRDLRVLGINKRKMRDSVLYELPAHDASQEILRLAVTHIEYNESMIVITTLAGLASVVADYLDIHLSQDILGTIAGENCIFIAPRLVKLIPKLTQDIKKLLNFKQK